MRQRRRAQLELITHNQTKGKGKTQYTEHGTRTIKIKEQACQCKQDTRVYHGDWRNENRDKTRH